MTNKPSKKGNQNGVKATNGPDLKSSVPFMDTFYALASDEVQERSLAASSMMRHLFSQEITESDDDMHKIAVIKDGYYAFTRLMKGLCSGRSSARQGYASCLSTFLELSFKLSPDSGSNSDRKKCWMEYYMENEDSHNKKSNAGLSPSEFVHNQLMDHTGESSSADKNGATKRVKGGAEERDNMHGKLFGILAVVRSQTLFLHQPSVKVTKSYILDLLSLYSYKNWMQEPSMHALQELVSSICENSDMNILTDVVDTVLPSFFDGKPETWTAEKISIYLHLQTLYMNAKLTCNDVVLPKTLRSPLLTSAALSGSPGALAATLKDTSKVVYPRCHIVWKNIWSYLTLPVANITVTTNGKGSSPKIIDKKDPNNRSLSSCEGCSLRESLIVGSESSEEILKSLVDGVISFSLLGNDRKNISTNSVSGKVETTGTNNITYERRALALTLINQLCKLRLSATIIESIVLQPDIVKKLFIHTMSSSHKNTMKPLATHFLNEIAASVNVDWNSDVSTYLIEKRLAVIKALIKSNPAFDNVTRTETVAMLLNLKKNDYDNSFCGKKDDFWRSYFSFLKDQVFESHTSPETSKKYIDLIYSLANHLLKFGSIGNCEEMVRSILSYLMVGGLFDVKTLHSNENEPQTHENSDSCKFLTAAQTNKKHLLKIKSTCAFPYVVRVAMSSRFFTLLSEVISTSPSLKLPERESKEASRNSKMRKALDLLDFVRLGWCALQDNGALPLRRSYENSETKSIIISCRKLDDELHQLFNSIDSGEKDTPKARAISGIVCLVSSLIIQLLNPGSPSSTEPSDWEDLDEEDEDSVEEIHELILELSNIAKFLNEIQPVANLQDDEDSNKLTSLAVVCVNILSTSLGGNSSKQSASHGQIGKLVRLLTTSAWSACLSAPTDDTFLVDEDVMNTILQAVCGSTFMSSEDDNDCDSDAMEDEEDEVFGSNDSEQLMDLDDSSDENKPKSEVDDHVAQDDVELDPSSLQNLLLEDSDTEEEELEHHAGADSALAQLIKMKQEARKAGKEQREKFELVYRMRCMALLEAMFNCKTKFSQNTVMISIRPLLRARKQLDKSTASTVMLGTEGKRKGSLFNEKLALLGRISTLIEKKIAKYDVKDLAPKDDCLALVSDLLDNLKEFKSLSHRSCCSAMLTMMAKAITENFEESILTVSSLFEEVVEEWSKKRKSNLASSIFVDLIIRTPRFSRIVLPIPLATAALGARSSFFKTEALSLIGSLYNIPISDVEKNSTEVISLSKALPSIASAIAAALEDTNLIQAKKSRDVSLKVAEKVVAYCENNKSAALWSSIIVMKESLEKLSKSTSIGGVVSRCAKIHKDILEGEKKQVIPETPSEKKNKNIKRKKAKGSSKDEDTKETPLSSKGKKKRKKVKNKGKDL